MIKVANEKQIGNHRVKVVDFTQVHIQVDIDIPPQSQMVVF